MPYIPQEQREQVDSLIESLAYTVNTQGQANYIVSKFFHTVLQRSGELKYDALNNAIGLLECIKLELYRQVVAPYEDVKMWENNTVSDLEMTHEAIEARSK